MLKRNMDSGEAFKIWPLGARTRLWVFLMYFSDVGTDVAVFL